jgi:hypothetical protein
MSTKTGSKKPSVKAAKKRTKLDPKYKFTKAELQNKTNSITVRKLNTVIKSNVGKLNSYQKLTDISDLKLNDQIKYVRLDDSKFRHGGTVILIKKKNDGDYHIRFRSNVTEETNLLLSTIVVFYKHLTAQQARKLQTEKWKENMRANFPEVYAKWDTAKGEERIKLGVQLNELSKASTQSKK